MDKGRQREYCDRQCSQRHSEQCRQWARGWVQAEGNSPTARQAKCGHGVPGHRGRQRRMCEDCARQLSLAAAKVCQMCAAPLPPLRNGRGPQRRIYCSKTCDKRAAAARLSAARLAARPPIDCPSCGQTFARSRRDQRFCSQFCAEVARGQRLPSALPVRVCALSKCETEFQPLFAKQRCCSETHGKRLWNRENPGPWTDRRRDNYHRRRALKAGTSNGEPVRLAEIQERDGNRCHLCRKKVSNKAWPHPLSPSLDHVVPLSRGGAHEPSNVRLAHLGCNVSKGNGGGGEQLLLNG